MTAGRLNWFWVLSIVFLVAITIAGGLIAWSRYRPSQPIEITMSPEQEIQGTVYISGAVANPGLYSLKPGDTIETLIQAAGGTTTNANLNGLKLYIPDVEEEQAPQKIDINRAEAWLLEALPGVGPAKAQAIVDYREQNGPFLNINELTKVEGIG